MKLDAHGFAQFGHCLVKDGTPTVVGFDQTCKSKYLAHAPFRLQILVCAGLPFSLLAMIDKAMEHMGSPDFVTWLVKWPLPFIKLIPTNAITLIFVLGKG